MNKLLSKLLILPLLSLSVAAQADVFLGVDAELNYWKPSVTVGKSSKLDENEALFGDISFEHFVPFVPNIKIGRTVLDASFGVGGEYTVRYEKTDTNLYYEILDNDTISVDLGLGFSYLDYKTLHMDNSLGSISGTIPHVYGAVEVGIPLTPLFVYSKGTLSNLNDNTVIDATIGVQYEIELTVIDIELQSGYRIQKFDMDDFDNSSLDLKIDGFFAGVNIDF